MDTSVFTAIALACAPAVHPDTARAVVQVESSFNPWAIGVVGGQLARQPKTRSEALSTARELHAQRWNFSVGLGQINVRNFERLGLTVESAFDPCANLTALQSVLSECFERASAAWSSTPQVSLRQALSCYYSGNWVTGFDHGYVRRVVQARPRHRPSPLAVSQETP